MNLSQAGYDLITSFEGYLKPNGRIMQGVPVPGWRVDVADLDALRA